MSITVIREDLTSLLLTLDLVNEGTRRAGRELRDTAMPRCSSRVQRWRHRSRHAEDEGVLLSEGRVRRTEEVHGDGGDRGGPHSVPY